jgi:hypothetical protein
VIGYVLDKDETVIPDFVKNEIPPTDNSNILKLENSMILSMSITKNCLYHGKPLRFMVCS